MSAGQFWHWAASPVENCPAGHAWQMLPVEQASPALQLHGVQLCAPAREKKPGSQASQIDCPPVFECLPAGHVLHSVSLPGEYFPALHCLQLLVAEVEDAGQSWPGAQSHPVQLGASVPEKKPAEHAVQTELPTAAANFPAGHDTHTWAFPGEYCPVSHCLQSPVAAVDDAGQACPAAHSHPEQLATPAPEKNPAAHTLH